MAVAAAKDIEKIVESRIMSLLITGKNLWIVDKKPQDVSEINYAEGVLFIGKEQIRIKEIYAALYCKEIRNITFIVQNAEIHRMTLVLETNELFEHVFAYIKENCEELSFSEQGKKINGYAASLVEKLEEGITVTIIETKEAKEIFCPECGMQCDPNIPYCLECGASV